MAQEQVKRFLVLHRGGKAAVCFARSNKWCICSADQLCLNVIFLYCHILALYYNIMNSFLLLTVAEKDGFYGFELALRRRRTWQFLRVKFIGGFCTSFFIFFQETYISIFFLSCPSTLWCKSSLFTFVSAYFRLLKNSPSLSPLFVVILLFGLIVIVCFLPSYFCTYLILVILSSCLFFSTPSLSAPLISRCSCGCASYRTGAWHSPLSEPACLLCCDVFVN